MHFLVSFNLPTNTKQSLEPPKRRLRAAFQALSVEDACEAYTGNFSIDACMLPDNLEAAIAHLDDTFQQRLFHLIDESGKGDVDIYKKADITRQNFHKIRSNKDYMPRKNTAIRLALALELNIDKTTDLLRRAGYALSSSNKADVIIQFFIEHNIHSLLEINQAIYQLCGENNIL